MRKIYQINESWKFSKVISNENSEMSCSEPYQILNLPHTWNVDDNRDRCEHLYQKIITIPEQHKDEVIYLEFLGANSVCRVYMNNKFVGEHRGGYSTFRFDITDFYDWDKENVVNVYVDNSTTEDVSPLNGDFTIYGGLYRSVNLICCSKTHFDLGYWGTDGVIIRSEANNDSGIIHVEMHPICDVNDLVEIKITDQNDNVIHSQKRSALDKNIDIRIENPNLWRGAVDPYLYSIEVNLEHNNVVCDRVKKFFGFRNCSLKADLGFFLNNDHYYINGVAKHQDFEGVGNAISEDLVDKDLEIIREIGANALRLSHYQHDQYIYDRCDQEGYVVWAEIPMMSLPNREGVMENAKSQLTELILQNCHHPSICFWGIQNEIAMEGESLAMYRSVEVLNDLAHELLPDCITASANMYFVKNKSYLNHITDMLGYNHYFGWYYGEIQELDGWLDQFHQDNPDVSIGISEYGADSNLKFHTEHPKVKDYSEEFQSIYHEQTYKIIRSKAYLWGSFIWNMFDFGSDIRNEGGTIGKNAKGLVSFDRKTKKDSFYLYKAYWSKEPFIHICEKRFINRATDRISIKVYSNLSEVTLCVNDDTFATRKGETVFIFEDIELRDGTNEIKVYHNDIVDTAAFEKVDEPDKSYCYVDPNPEINVKNWFTNEIGEVDLFPEDSYSVLDTIDTLMKNEMTWSIIKEMAPKIAERGVPGSPVTLLWVVNIMKGVFSEEDLKAINRRLIRIKKDS